MFDLKIKKQDSRLEVFFFVHLSLNMFASLVEHWLLVIHCRVNKARLSGLKMVLAHMYVAVPTI